MADLRASEMSDINDRLLLDAQRSASRGDWAMVMACADEALKNDPLRVEAMYLVAMALRHAGSEGAAAQLLSLATKIEPKRAQIWTQLAMCLHERHPEDAYRGALRAQQLRPDEPDTLSLLVNVSGTLGRHAEALDWAARSEMIHGVQGEVSHNKSFALMALGRWKEGWRAFRPSLGQPARKVRNFHADRETPRWNPEKHENATVVIYGEQGIGDEILYASMIDRAITAAEAKGSRVIVECDKRNEGLFAGSFSVPVYGTRSETYCEWPLDEGVTHKIEMGGIGEYFATEPFRRGKYLCADGPRKEAFAAWLRVHERSNIQSQPKRYPIYEPENKVRTACEEESPIIGLSPMAASTNWLGRAKRIGLAWTGGSWETGRRRRSIPAEKLITLAGRFRNDATFVCLEYDEREQRETRDTNILNPHWATRKGADYGELAALVANLDLVIAVQTSVVDLCGALGVPCIALCNTAPQWRYSGHFGPDTMFFYESVRVLRQETEGDWTPVVAGLEAELAALTARRAA